VRLVQGLCPGDVHTGKDEPELGRLAGDRVQDPPGVFRADDLQAQTAEAVGVEVAVVLTAPAPCPVNMLLAPG
jgi:hypothetical protein